MCSVLMRLWPTASTILIVCAIGERKTYGKTAGGKQITDALIDVLIGKAEAGYEIEELNELMDIAEAKAKLDAVLGELAAAGFSIWGWDDESIQIGKVTGSNPVRRVR